MKIIISILLVAVVVGLWLLLRSRKQSPTAQQGPSGVARKGAFDGLRSQAFQVTRNQLGLPAPAVPTEPFGVLMEIGYEKGSATAIALADGSASIYLSTGGGSIGGAGHESIRKAAQRMVSVAAKFQPQTKTTKDFPLPKNGQTIF